VLAGARGSAGHVRLEHAHPWAQAVSAPPPSPSSFCAHPPCCIARAACRWVLFPPTFSREEVKGRHHVRKAAGEDDEAIDWFTNVLPRVKAEIGRERVRAHAPPPYLAVDLCCLSTARRGAGSLGSRGTGTTSRPSVRPVAPAAADCSHTRSAQTETRWWVWRR
jgi:hypothetical protein